MRLIGNAILCYENGVNVPVFITSANVRPDECTVFDGVLFGSVYKEPVTRGLPDIRKVIF